MIPIQEVLHRIQWDPACRGSVFEIGYIDRLAGAVVRVPFESLRLEAGPHAALRVTDKDGTVCRIPLHRVREVWRDGQTIWRRGGSSLSET
jgi:uncharacterized protein (UPF0248 family)